MSADYFFLVSARAFESLRQNEIASLYYRGESSAFIRFNKARIRQPGQVRQQAASLVLIHGRRHTATYLTLTGQFEQDAKSLNETLEAMRAIIRAVPEDPYLLYDTEPRESVSVGKGQVVEPRDALTAILDLVRNYDFVGLWASGSIERGFSSSLGHRYWKEIDNFNLDFSIYAERDKAAKGSYAGVSFDTSILAERIGRTTRQVEVLRRPQKRLEPGAYRVYLTPTALSEILLLLSGDAFSVKAHRTKRTPLLRMINGEASFDKRLELADEANGGMAPRFLPYGFFKPERIDLISAGQIAQVLVSPRSAREYGLQVNASQSERPSSIAMGPGDLATADVLRRLDTGLYVTDLWYANYSDLAGGRVTGLTRFATTWVEKGQIVAPSAVMRFDDTLYRILGSELEALTAEREWIYDSNTYFERSTDSLLLPGALIRSFVLSL
jgi:predicted Zn-dependent protease